MKCGVLLWMLFRNKSKQTSDLQYKRNESQKAAKEKYKRLYIITLDLPKISKKGQSRETVRQVCLGLGWQQEVMANRTQGILLG